MSSSMHHIQSVRYNRRLQYAPKDRIIDRNRSISKYLKRKVSLGRSVLDYKSSEERELIRHKFKYARRRDAIVGLTITILCSLIAWKLIISFF